MPVMPSPGTSADKGGGVHSHAQLCSLNKIFFKKFPFLYFKFFFRFCKSGNGNSNGNGNGYCNGSGYYNGNGNDNGYCDGNGSCNGNGYCDGNGNGYCNGYGNGND
jgi:hypothetical protein